MKDLQGREVHASGEEEDIKMGQHREDEIRRNITLKIVILGPPGAGKGTYAKLLMEKMRIPHISTGDLLRDIVKNQSELGRKISSFMGTGNLVPDELVFEVLKIRFANSDCKDGFILDGFPRTLHQANLLEMQGFSPDVVVNINVREEEILKRLSGRRQCINCGSIYNLYFHPPQKEGICDICNGSLYQREDDKMETVKERMKVYYKKTRPLENFYRKKKILKEFNGEGSIGENFNKILSLIVDQGNK